jgi:hypothetical protein
VPTRSFCTGVHWTVESFVAKGEAPAEAFFEALEGDTGRSGNALPALLATITTMANLSPNQRMSHTRFRHVTDQPGLYEFKSDQLRLFCIFAPGRRIILLNGIIGKKQNEHRASEREAVKQAMRLKAAFEAAKA